MSRLTIEFELSEDAAVIQDGRIAVDLGNGVTLLTQAPKGLERINSVVLQVVMEVEGVLYVAEQASVERTHETAVDGGQQIRENGGPRQLGVGGLQTENP